VAMRRKKARGTRLDLGRPIMLIAQAMRMRPSARTQFYLWKLQVVDEKIDHTSGLLVESRRVLDGGSGIPPKQAADASKIWALVRSRSNKREAQEALRKHRNDMGAWSVSFLSRSVPAQGAIEPDEVFTFVDRL